MTCNRNFILPERLATFVAEVEALCVEYGLVFDYIPPGTGEFSILARMYDKDKEYHMRCFVSWWVSDRLLKELNSFKMGTKKCKKNK